MERVLVISPHMDDAELAMGGTLLRHRDDGDEIILSVMNTDEFRTGASFIRQEEQERSCKMLGVKETVYLTSLIPIDEKVRILDEVQPTILYFPFESDTHQAHSLASKVGMAVSRNISITVMKYLCTTSYSYYPNVLNVIDMEKKKELCSVFKSQLDRKPKFMEILEAQNRFFGSLIGNGHYAEGFMLFRKVNYLQHHKEVEG